MQSLYFNAVRSDLDRLLAQLDRDPHSPTSGCFDWKYWHDRIVDTPSLHDQEAVYVLALLYSQPYEDNPFFGNALLLSWIESAVRFWASRQHADGSIDEFYPWERQFGATAIVAWAMTESALVLGDALSEECCQLVRKTALASRAFILRDESVDLTNHKTQALMALVNIQRLTGVDCSAQINEYLEAVRSLYNSKEGWFAEYGGPDAGYQSVTLAFLARYRAVTGDDSVSDMLHGAAEFLCYAFWGEGLYGGQVFSRGTSHIWMSGFEMLAQEHEGARAVCAHVRPLMEQGAIFGPRQQDRYFSEQMYDWLYSATVAQPLEAAPPLPCKGAPGVWSFDEAGLMAVRTSDYYALVSGVRGGCVQAADDKGKSIIDAGVTVCNPDESMSTSQAFSPGNTWRLGGDAPGSELSGKWDMKVSGQLRPLEYTLPFPFRQMVFRLLLMICSVHPALSRYFKKLLVCLLIRGRESDCGRFSRRVRFMPEGVTVEDRLESLPPGKKMITVGQPSRTRFVAYAKAFHHSELVHGEAFATPPLVVREESVSHERKYLIGGDHG